MKEEPGMALALVIMVLIGVMGAGLIVFVTRDLDGMIESNQGQTAFILADAGAQASKTGVSYLSYDGITNASANPPNPADSTCSCGV